MKMTVIRKDDGTIIGLRRASIIEHTAKESGGLRAGPGQKIEEVEVPDELAAIDDGEELHKRVMAHLSKKK